MKKSIPGRQICTCKVPVVGQSVVCAVRGCQCGWSTVRNAQRMEDARSGKWVVRDGDGRSSSEVVSPEKGEGKRDYLSQGLWG